MLGFGIIGQAVLPLLQTELGIKWSRVRIVKTREDTTGIAAPSPAAWPGCCCLGRI